MSQSHSEPRILERCEHPISRSGLGESALKVLYRLHGGGYQAYLVGGSVRDLMLQRQPKDYDVSTNAKPNEIRRLFRNSRIIGRRFRLVHVIFHDGVVEVSTFRSNPDPSEQKRAPGELLVTSDNTFGTPQQDAHRRDFTVNALFYSIADFSIIDYVGGIEDLNNRVIRVIGEPNVRFREDPVRMLRACEFAGRLGFSIEERTQESIYDLRRELDKAAPARLTEELIQLLRCGQAGPSAQWMIELGLLDELLPEVRAMMSGQRAGIGDFSRVLPVIDGMIRAGNPLSDEVLLAAIVLPSLVIQRGTREAELGQPLTRCTLRRFTEESIGSFAQRFALSHHKTQRIFYAVDSFHRMCEPLEADGRRRLASRPSFPDALQLFEILVEASGEGREALTEWKELPHDATAPRREAPRRRRRQRRRRRA